MADCMTHTDTALVKTSTLFVEQLYTPCIAEACYYIESGGEAVVIDPLRDPRPYVDLAKSRNAKIKYILETHFHADFVSGHVDLQKETGATIVYGPTANPEGFTAHIARDYEILKVGQSTIMVLHTPGHTMESSCYLLNDDNGMPVGVFTGDTLFLGDVGRPDLAQKAASMTQEELARTLFKSLRNKLMPLPDDITVWPGHGAGSACGKALSTETVDKLGNQKKNNYALRATMTEDEFVMEVLEGLSAPPGYFPSNVALNKAAPTKSFAQVLAGAENKFAPADFAAVLADKEVLCIDTRDRDTFRDGFCPGSVYIGSDGMLAPYLGKVFPDITQKFAVISRPGEELEMAMRMSRIGYDNCVGHLVGGFEAWKAAGMPVNTIKGITGEEFVRDFDAKTGAYHAVDVRSGKEYEQEHYNGTILSPMCRVPIEMDMIPEDKPAVYICRTGYRALLFLTRAMRLGWKPECRILVGGMEAIEKASTSREKFVVGTHY